MKHYIISSERHILLCININNNNNNNNEDINNKNNNNTVINNKDNSNHHHDNQDDYITDMIMIPSSTTTSSSPVSILMDRIVLTERGQLIRMNYNHNRNNHNNNNNNNIISTSDDNTTKNNNNDIIWQCNLNTMLSNSNDDDDDDDEDDNNDNDKASQPTTDIVVDNDITSNVIGQWLMINRTSASMSTPSSALLCCIDHKYGAIVTININNGDMELVGQFDNGILNATWNHTADILAIVTKIPIEIEQEIEQESESESEQNEGVVIVRQEQKELLHNDYSNVLLLMNTNYDVMEEIVIPTIQCNTTISLFWNTIGTLLAISSIDDTSNDTKQQRIIRIYQRQHDTISLLCNCCQEDGNGLLIPNLYDSGSGMCWADGATSNLLTAIQTKGTKAYNVLFIESYNGLRHGQFNISIPDGYKMIITSITYNHQHSDILCITSLLYHTTTITIQVQLYYRSNYYWYHIQNIQIPIIIDIIENTDMTTLIDTYKNIKAKFINYNHVVIYGIPAINSYNNHNYYEYQFQWNTSMILPTAVNNGLLSYIVDGNQLHMNNITNHAMIPPPFYGNSITMNNSNNSSSSIQSIVRPLSLIHNNNNNNNVIITCCIILSNGTIVVLGFSNDQQQQKQQKRKLQKNYPIILATIHRHNDNNDHNFNGIIRHAIFIQTSNTSIQLIGCCCSVLSSDTTTSSSLLMSHDELIILDIEWNHDNDPTTAAASSSTIGVIKSICYIPLNRLHQSLSSNDDENDDDNDDDLMPLSIYNITPYSDNNNDINNDSIMIQYDSGTCIDYNVNYILSLSSKQQKQDTENNNIITNVNDESSSTTIVPKKLLVLIEPCPWISCIKVPYNVIPHQQHEHQNEEQHPHIFPYMIFGLSLSGKLYCNDILLCHSVTSYTLTYDYDYICYTTTTTIDNNNSNDNKNANSNTSTQCMIRFISLYELYNHYDPYLGSEENMIILNGYEPRYVERGAVLIATTTTPTTTVMTASSSTLQKQSQQPSPPYCILQMPRGNIEMICPKALLLRTIIRYIIQYHTYDYPFILMRKYKIDLNLLYDINPIQFINVGCYQLLYNNNIDYLNLFISSLKNDDCTKTKYYIPTWWLLSSSTSLDPNNNNHIDRVNDNMAGNSNNTTIAEYNTNHGISKINIICHRLRSIMIQIEEEGQEDKLDVEVIHGDVVVDKTTTTSTATTTNMNNKKFKRGHFLLPILSTFAKEEPPQLANALTLIKENALRWDNNIDSKDNLTKNKTTIISKKKSWYMIDIVQSSIQYLAFLADYEILFNTALGMYDYDMARAVIRNNSSQMDPKKYNPLIQRYQKILPKFYARYEVDMKLKQYELALRHLYQSYIHQEGMVTEDVTDPVNLPIINKPTIQNDFECCTKHIVLYQLYQMGLELFYENPEQLRTIMLTYGDYLLTEKKQPLYALHIYLATDPIDLDRSLKAAREAKDWKLFFTLYDSNNRRVDNTVDVVDATTRSDIAKQIATELASTVNETNKKDIYEDCARILLDYGNIDSHIMEAIDYYLLAESWKEAKRICCSKLQQFDDVLQNRIMSSVMSYISNTMNDIEERAETFQVTYKRYKEVLKILHDINLSNNIHNIHNDDYDHHPNLDDDAGSLFSAASTNASNASIRSASSTGTVGSLSSVISVKSDNSFSITGTETSFRHKSKYNQIGKQHEPKKQRNRKTRNERKQAKSKAKKIQPGSQEELDGLIQILDNTSCRILSYDTDSIQETIFYLMNDHHHMVDANELYQKYIWFSTIIQTTIENMKKISNDPNTTSTTMTTRNTVNYETRNVDVLMDVKKTCYDDPTHYCPPLSVTIHEIMAFFPTHIFFGEK